jgi:hypothetical protein
MPAALKNSSHGKIARAEGRKRTFFSSSGIPALSIARAFVTPAKARIFVLIQIAIDDGMSVAHWFDMADRTWCVEWVRDLPLGAALAALALVGCGPAASDDFAGPALRNHEQGGGGSTGSEPDAGLQLGGSGGASGGTPCETGGSSSTEVPGNCGSGSGGTSGAWGDTPTCSAPPLGSWDDTPMPDVVYTATSDGFVVVRAQMPSGPTRQCFIQGFTDAADPPTSNRISTAVVDNSVGQAEAQSGGFTMPVRAGDHWTVTTSGGHCSGVSLAWLPSGGFGAWDDTVALDTSTIARTDGFVVVNASMPSGPARSCVIQGLTDATDPPTSNRISTSVVDNTTNRTEVQYGGFMLPVRSGDYWKVTTSGSLCSGVSVSWLPACGLGAWDDTLGFTATTPSATDGFVVVNVVMPPGPLRSCVLEGYTDALSPSVANRIASSVVDNATADTEPRYGGFTLPVRAADFWQVTQSGTCSGASLSWVPFGV